MGTCFGCVIISGSSKTIGTTTDWSNNNETKAGSPTTYKNIEAFHKNIPPMCKLKYS